MTVRNKPICSRSIKLVNIILVKTFMPVAPKWPHIQYVQLLQFTILEIKRHSKAKVRKPNQTSFSNCHVLIDNNIKLPSIENSNKLSACLFVRKCLDKSTDKNFHGYFTEINHTIATRNNNCGLIVPKIRTEFGKCGFFFQGCYNVQLSSSHHKKRVGH